MLSKGPVTINDQTFYIGGQPHQLINAKVPLTYSVCLIEDNPWVGETRLLRIRLHTGNLQSCIDFISKQLELKGDGALQNTQAREA